MLDLLSPRKLWHRLAMGGMSEVFKVPRKLPSGQLDHVVVKVLFPQYVDDQRVVEMFYTEADLGMRLKHPNIVRALGRGVVENRPAIVLEYVDGPDVETLSRNARREGVRLHPSIAVEIVLQALQGLRHAHELKDSTGRSLGLVHRDISPENLFCTRVGVVKVADFGIAKMLMLESQTDPAFGVRGKASFMSPERMEGRNIDARADVYSLGLVLYELLTASRPLAAKPGENPLDHANRVVNARIAPVHTLVPELPRMLSDVVMRAIAPRLEERYRSCRELSDALLQVVAKHHLGSGPSALADWIAELSPSTPLQAAGL